MLSLVERIRGLCSQSDWSAEDLTTDQPIPPSKVLTRYSLRLLSEITRECENVSAIALFLPGIQPEELTRVAVLQCTENPVANSIPEKFPYLDHLEYLLDKYHRVWRISNWVPFTLNSLDSSNERRWLISLHRSGEFVGVITVVLKEIVEFASETLSKIQAALTAISFAVSEEAAWMRSLVLAEEPFRLCQSTNNSERDISDVIVQLSTIGMAADFSALRVFDDRSERLTLRATWPRMGSRLEEITRLEEAVSAFVFNDRDSTGSAAVVSGPHQYGTMLDANLQEQLKVAGLLSYVAVTFASIDPSVKNGTRSGILTVFYRRPHPNAIRDVAFLHRFISRAANDIALVRQKERLDEVMLSLQVQFNMITRAEAIALLAHDLAHKAIRANEAVVTFSDKCRKAMREGRPFDFVKPAADEAQEACQAIENEIFQIKRIGGNIREDESWFLLHDLLGDMAEQIQPVLDRAGMSIEIRCPNGLYCFGQKHVLGQVFLNLAINSIDAQKSLRHSKHNTIHILCAVADRQKRGEWISVAFWDEGPGISYAAFPDANDVFGLGKTSKPDGTGLGLPISRSLLAKHFGGDLQLRERRPAHFEILIPLRDRRG